MVLIGYEQSRSYVLDWGADASILGAFEQEATYCRSGIRNKENTFCFHIQRAGADVLHLRSDYYIGLDWVIPNKVALHIQPKLNKEEAAVDYVAMLMDSLDNYENIAHLDDLLIVDFDAPTIKVQSEQDTLTPFILVQFLKLVQRIVKKGLKKAYYKVTDNLNSKVKGKINIATQIKQNIVKNRLTRNNCTYQEFGYNHIENQFLKSVLGFVWHHIHEQQSYFTKAQQAQLILIINYCRASFLQVDEVKSLHSKVLVSKNTFYKDYEEAIKLGQMILKRYSYSISRSEDKSFTQLPPHWIDMSKLFELYVFAQLKLVFSGAGVVSYHDRYLGGKETDILIKEKGYECVIDCKYKPQYANSTPDLEDKRQLAGYTRLKSVYNKLEKPSREVIKGIIIYPDQAADKEFAQQHLFENSIDEYVDFYKVGIRLPEK